MANIARLTINWTGFVGSPGYTNLYFEATAGGDVDQAVVDNAKTITETWLAAFRPDLPNNCFTGVDSTVANVDEETGAIQSFFTVNPTAPAAGAANGQYAAGTGVCVNWGTDGVRNGRRVRGRTFIVPLGILGYASDGTLAPPRLTAWRNASATFIAAAGAARLVVWKRPTILGIDGGAYDVNSYSIGSKVAQLRSRRD